MKVIEPPKGASTEGLMSEEDMKKSLIAQKCARIATSYFNGDTSVDSRNALAGAWVNNMYAPTSEAEKRAVVSSMAHFLSQGRYNSPEFFDFMKAMESRNTDIENPMPFDAGALPYNDIVGKPFGVGNLQRNAPTMDEYLDYAKQMFKTITDGEAEGRNAREYALEVNGLGADYLELPYAERVKRVRGNSNWVEKKWADNKKGVVESIKTGAKNVLAAIGAAPAPSVHGIPIKDYKQPELEEAKKEDVLTREDASSSIMMLDWLESKYLGIGNPEQASQSLTPVQRFDRIANHLQASPDIAKTDGIVVDGKSITLPHSLSMNGDIELLKKADEAIYTNQEFKKWQARAIVANNPAVVPFFNQWANNVGWIHLGGMGNEGDLAETLASEITKAKDDPEALKAAQRTASDVISLIGCLDNRTWMASDWDAVTAMSGHPAQGIGKVMHGASIVGNIGGTFVNSIVDLFTQTPKDAFSYVAESYRRVFGEKFTEEELIKQSLNDRVRLHSMPMMESLGDVDEIGQSVAGLAGIGKGADYILKGIRALRTSGKVHKASKRVAEAEKKLAQAEKALPETVAKANAEVVAAEADLAKAIELGTQGEYVGGMLTAAQARANAAKASVRLAKAQKAEFVALVGSEKAALKYLKETFTAFDDAAKEIILGVGFASNAAETWKAQVADEKELGTVVLGDDLVSARGSLHEASTPLWAIQFVLGNQAARYLGDPANATGKKLLAELIKRGRKVAEKNGIPLENVGLDRLLANSISTWIHRTTSRAAYGAYFGSVNELSFDLSAAAFAASQGEDPSKAIAKNIDIANIITEGGKMGLAFGIMGAPSEAVRVRAENASILSLARGSSYAYTIGKIAGTLAHEQVEETADGEFVNTTKPDATKEMGRARIVFAGLLSKMGATKDSPEARRKMVDDISKTYGTEVAKRVEAAYEHLEEANKAAVLKMARRVETSVDAPHLKNAIDALVGHGVDIQIQKGENEGAYSVNINVKNVDGTTTPITFDVTKKDWTIKPVGTADDGTVLWEKAMVAEIDLDKAVTKGYITAEQANEVRKLLGNNDTKIGIKDANGVDLIDKMIKGLGLKTFGSYAPDTAEVKIGTKPDSTDVKTRGIVTTHEVAHAILMQLHAQKIISDEDVAMMTEIARASGMTWDEWLIAEGRRDLITEAMDAKGIYLYDGTRIIPTLANKVGKWLADIGKGVLGVAERNYRKEQTEFRFMDFVDARIKNAKEALEAREKIRVADAEHENARKAVFDRDGTDNPSPLSSIIGSKAFTMTPDIDMIFKGEGKTPEDFGFVFFDGRGEYLHPSHSEFDFAMAQHIESKIMGENGELSLEKVKALTPEEQEHLVAVIDDYGELQDLAISADGRVADLEGVDVVLPPHFRGRTDIEAVPYTEVKDIVEDAQKPTEERHAISGLFTGSAADYANLDALGNIVNGPSLHYIGSGIAEQVHGWGLYAADRRGAAERYAGAIAADRPRRLYIDGEPFEANLDLNDTKNLFREVLANAYHDHFIYGDDFKECLKWWLDGYKLNNEELTPAQKAAIPLLEEALKDVDKTLARIEMRPASEYVYEQTFFTNREPGDESHLLSWYEPVSRENAERIANALSAERIEIIRHGGLLTPKEYKIGSGNTKFEASYFDRMTGRDVYAWLATIFSSPEAASELLARADIDGVKYPDDVFGNTYNFDGRNGWNYVSFRDDNIRVDHKWVDGQKRYLIGGVETATAEERKQLAEFSTLLGDRSWDDLNQKEMVDLWKKTGWYIGTDGMPRRELLDPYINTEKLLETCKEVTSKKGAVKLMKLKEFLDEAIDKEAGHDAFHKKFPALKNIDVKIQAKPLKGAYASYMPNTKTIVVSAPDFVNDADDAVFVASIMLHEMQHAIQQRENFAPGGSRDSAKALIPLANRLIGDSIRDANSWIAQVDYVYDRGYLSSFNKLDQSRVTDVITVGLEIINELGDAIPAFRRIAREFSSVDWRKATVYNRRIMANSLFDLFQDVIRPMLKDSQGWSNAQLLKFLSLEAEGEKTYPHSMGEPESYSVQDRVYMPGMDKPSARDKAPFVTEAAHMPQDEQIDESTFDVILRRKFKENNGETISDMIMSRVRDLGITSLGGNKPSRKVNRHMIFSHSGLLNYLDGSLDAYQNFMKQVDEVVDTAIAEYKSEYRYDGFMPLWAKTQAIEEKMAREGIKLTVRDGKGNAIDVHPRMGTVGGDSTMRFEFAVEPKHRVTLPRAFFEGEDSGKTWTLRDFLKNPDTNPLFKLYPSLEKVKVKMVEDEDGEWGADMEKPPLATNHASAKVWYDRDITSKGYPDAKSKGVIYVKKYSGMPSSGKVKTALAKDLQTAIVMAIQDYESGDATLSAATGYRTGMMSNSYMTKDIRSASDEAVDNTGYYTNPLLKQELGYLQPYVDFLKDFVREQFAIYGDDFKLEGHGKRMQETLDAIPMMFMDVLSRSFRYFSDRMEARFLGDRFNMPKDELASDTSYHEGQRDIYERGLLDPVFAINTIYLTATDRLFRRATGSPHGPIAVQQGRLEKGEDGKVADRDMKYSQNTDIFAMRQLDNFVRNVALPTIASTLINKGVPAGRDPRTQNLIFAPAFKLGYRSGDFHIEHVKSLFDKFVTERRKNDADAIQIGSGDSGATRTTATQSHGDDVAETVVVDPTSTDAIYGGIDAKNEVAIVNSVAKALLKFKTSEESKSSGQAIVQWLFSRGYSRVDAVDIINKAIHSTGEVSDTNPKNAIEKELQDFVASSMNQGQARHMIGSLDVSDYLAIAGARMWDSSDGGEKATEYLRKQLRSMGTPAAYIDTLAEDIASRSFLLGGANFGTSDPVIGQELLRYFRKGAGVHLDDVIGDTLRRGNKDYFASLAKEKARENRMKAAREVPRIKGETIDTYLKVRAGIDLLSELYNLGSKKAKFADTDAIAMAIEQKWVELAQMDPRLTPEEVANNFVLRSSWGSAVADMVTYYAKKILFGRSREHALMTAAKLRTITVSALRSKPMALNTATAVLSAQLDVIGNVLRKHGTKNVDNKDPNALFGSRRLVEKIVKYIDKNAMGKLRVSVSTPDIDRKVAPRVQQYWKYVKSALLSRPDTIATRIAELENELGVSASMLGADYTADASTLEARDAKRLELHALSKYGGLVNKLPGEVDDALAEIATDISGRVAEHEAKVESTRKYYEDNVDSIVNELKRSKSWKPSDDDRGRKSGLGRSILMFSVPSLFQRLRMDIEEGTEAFDFLTNMERDISEAERGRIVDSAFREKELRAAVEGIFGDSFERVMANLSVQDPDLKRFSKSLGRESLSRAQLMYIYAVTRQGENEGDSTYVNNMAFGRDGRYLADIRDALTSQELAMCDWMSKKFDEIRDEISVVCEAITGMPVLSPHEWYFPIIYKEDIKARSTKNFDIKRFPGFLKTRQSNKRKLDETVNIFSAYMDRVQDSMHYKHYANVSETAINVLKDSRVTDAYAKTTGTAYMNKMYDQLSDALSGGRVDMEGWLANFRNFTVHSSLFYNIPSAIRQVEGVAGWVADAGFGAFRGLFSSLAVPDTWDAIAELRASPVMRAREISGFSEPMDAIIREGRKGGFEKAANVLTTFVRENGMTPMRVMDAFACYTIGGWYYRHKTNMYLKQGLELSEAKRKALSDVDIAIQMQQSSSRQGYLHEWQRGGPAGRMMAQFAGPTLLRWGSEVEALHRLWMTKNGAAKAKAFNGLARKLFAFHVLCPTIMSALNFGIQMFAPSFQNESDEELLDRMLTQWVASMIAGPASNMLVLGDALTGLSTRAANSLMDTHVKQFGAMDNIPALSLLRRLTRDTSGLFESVQGYALDENDFDAVREDANKLMRDLFPLWRFGNNIHRKIEE